MHGSLLPTMDIAVREIVKIVSYTVNLPVGNMRSSTRAGHLNRKRANVDARRLVYAIAVRKHNMNFTQAGAIFLQDHSTVMHALKQHDDLLDTSKVYKENYDDCVEEYKKLDLKALLKGNLPSMYLAEVVEELREAVHTIEGLNVRIEILESNLNI